MTDFILKLNERFTILRILSKMENRITVNKFYWWRKLSVTNKLHHNNVVSNTPRHERGSN